MFENVHTTMHKNKEQVRILKNEVILLVIG